MKAIIILSLIGLSLAWCPFHSSSNDYPFSGDTYQKQSGSTKFDQVKKVVYDNLQPGDWYSVSMVELFAEDMNTSFDFEGDQLPKQGPFSSFDRKKLIHTVSVNANVEFVSNGQHSYTGILRGATNGIVRLSAAKAPDANLPQVAPGIGLKFFRDGFRSANLMAMYSLEGQTSFNMFQHDLTNHVPNIDANKVDFAQKQLLKAFLKASSWPTMIGLSDWCGVDEKGNKESANNFPYRLVFHPSNDAHTAFNSKPQSDKRYFVDQISGSKFDVLFHVYAQATPSSDSVEYIGDLKQKTQFLPSEFSDYKLFFQHTRFEDDLKLQPSWTKDAQKDVDTQAANYPWTYTDLPFDSVPAASYKI